MLELLLGVNLVGWLALGLLTFVTLALARQIGVLNERIAPAGTLAPSLGIGIGIGIGIGDLVPPLVVRDLAGRELTVGGAGPRGTLVLFVSPTCPVCRELVPLAAELARGRQIDLVFASEGGDPEPHRRYAAQHGIEAPYVLSAELVRSQQVVSLPFALLIDAAGVLTARALVDGAKQLEQLVDSGRHPGLAAVGYVAAGGRVDAPRSPS